MVQFQKPRKYYPEMFRRFPLPMMMGVEGAMVPVVPGMGLGPYRDFLRQMYTMLVDQEQPLEARMQLQEIILEYFHHHSTPFFLINLLFHPILRNRNLKIVVAVVVKVIVSNKLNSSINIPIFLHTLSALLHNNL